MTSYLNIGYDVMNYFAKFEKFLPHRIIILSFMTVRSQMPELDRGAFIHFNSGSQNTPYKLGLTNCGVIRQNIRTGVLKCGPNKMRFIQKTEVHIFSVWNEQ